MVTRAISSAVERLPYKQDVAGSKPASRIGRKHFSRPMEKAGREKICQASFLLRLRNLAKAFKTHRLVRVGW